MNEVVNVRVKRGGVGRGLQLSWNEHVNHKITSPRLIHTFAEYIKPIPETAINV